jgi:hypothetical protein
VREIEVVDVELRDGAGRSSSVFRSGQSMEVHVGLRARRAVERATLALELRVGSGERIFRTVTSIELGADGTAKLAFEVVDLALLGGDYDLALGAAAGREEAALERTVRFSVARSPGAEGVVDLRGSWRSLSPVEEVS